MNALYIVPNAINDLGSWTMILLDLLQFYYLASDWNPCFVLLSGLSLGDFWEANVAWNRGLLIQLIKWDIFLMAGCICPAFWCLRWESQRCLIKGHILSLFLPLSCFSAHVQGRYCNRKKIMISKVLSHKREEEDSRDDWSIIWPLYISFPPSFSCPFSFFYWAVSYT